MQASAIKAPTIHTNILLLSGLVVGMFFSLTRRYYPILPHQEFQHWILIASFCSAVLITLTLLSSNPTDRSSLGPAARYFVYAIGCSYFIWNGLLPTLNGFFDDSPGVERPASILYPTSQGRRVFSVDSVTIRIENGPKERLQLVSKYPVDRELHRKTQSAPVPVTIVEKQGFLGLLWVDSYRYGHEAEQ